MKKYIITSPAFTGDINVLYNQENILVYIDFMKCDLSVEQREYFKTKLPVVIDASMGEQGEEFLIRQFGKSRLNIASADFKISFEQWWVRYDRKVNKDRCIKLWEKLSIADQVSAFFKLQQYERYLSLNQWQTKADPEKYLRNKYWNNEYK